MGRTSDVICAIRGTLHLFRVLRSTLFAGFLPDAFAALFSSPAEGSSQLRPKTCAKAPVMNGFALSTLTVCGLHELDGHGARDVTHVLSLLDPGTPEPTAFSSYDPHVRATLYFHDAIEPAPDMVLPEMSDVERILAFARDAGDIRHLLIHCHMGVSRSTAAMLMVMAQAFPGEPEDVLVDRLMEIRPQAWPNSLMIALADERLERDGRLTAAIGRIYAGHLAKRPELAEIMIRMDRDREVELGRRRGNIGPR
jgi:predicted protein tyrosine phosphatase